MDDITVMQIITIEDDKFYELLHSLKDAVLIGTYWRRDATGNLVAQYVKATNQFVFIYPDNSQEKFAVKPVKNVDDAKMVAMRILMKERLRGSDVEVMGE